MMEITLTCPECGSGISFTPTEGAKEAECQVCEHKEPVTFTPDHFEGKLKDCPSCERKDFYKQKDFNRKIGVLLFVIAAILTLYMATTQYAMYSVAPFIILYVFDFILFRRLSQVAICYKCNAIFRNVSNMDEIYDFNHEMNDRIVYSDHDFKGEQLDHH